jgi:ATP-dependent helicase HrpB
LNKIHLPIDDVIPDVIEALRYHQAVIIRAEPGAGKTTRIPPALLDANIVPGEVVVLEPRRVAARAVARRIAYERGQKLGDEVGFRVRNERAGGQNTRLWVLTEGILTRRLQSDPLLEGVGIVVLDEFHERSIHADLAIAFLREVLEARDDLKVVVMSATLEAGPVSKFLNDAPSIDCPGRTFPLEIHHLHQDDHVFGVRDALHRLVKGPDDGGDVLVFLPGRREIEDVANALAPNFPQFEFVQLFGSQSAEDQDSALNPGSRRRVILSTNIAETSLTIPRVTAVIDSGLVRQLVASASTGIDELVTMSISLASAKQRAGRAGRTQPGRVIKLWSSATEHKMRDYDVAEIHRIDLSRPLMEVAAWGNIPEFQWYEAPPAARIERASELLGARGPSGLTAKGKRLHSMPLHPRLAAMIEAGKDRGCAKAVAELAALISEPDFVVRVQPDAPPAESDLLERWRLFPEVARGQVGRARSLGFEVHVGRARAAKVVADQLSRGLPADKTTSDIERLKACAAGFPDRIALQRARNYALAGGGSAAPGRESLVKDYPCMIAHVLFGTNRDGDAIIRMASAFETEWLQDVFPGVVQRRRQVSFDAALDRVVVREVVAFGHLALSEVPTSALPVDAEQMASALAGALRERMARGELAEGLLQRIDFLRFHCPELEIPDVAHGMDELWEGLCWGKRSLKEIKDVSGSLLGFLSATQRRALEEHAPARISVPSGSSIAVDYQEITSPVLAVKMQEVFGWSETPNIAMGRVPVLMHLLAPNRRPAQITNDLKSFWATTYQEIRKELRARYPKHSWPEDPYTAQAKKR